MLQLKLKTLMPLKIPQKKRKYRQTYSDVWKHFKRGEMRGDNSYEAVCNYCGNVMSKEIKGALVLWNITLWKVVRKFHGQRDIVKLMPCRRCCRLTIQ
jgi:BED zinc finger